MGDHRTRVAHDVLNYLVDHPNAQDTIEGITDWWLLEQCIKNRTLEVREALTELVACGFVIDETGGDSRVRYRINRTMLAQIREFLAKTDERATEE